MDTVFLYQRSLAVFSEMVGCTTSKELKNREIIVSHPAPEARRSTRPLEMGVYLGPPPRLPAASRRNGRETAPEPSGLRALSSAHHSASLLRPPAPGAENNPALSPIPAVGATPEPHQTAQHSAAARYLGGRAHYLASFLSVRVVFVAARFTKRVGFSPRAAAASSCCLSAFPTVSLSPPPLISVLLPLEYKKLPIPQSKLPEGFFFRTFHPTRGVSPVPASGS